MGVEGLATRDAGLLGMAINVNKVRTVAEGAALSSVYRQCVPKAAQYSKS